MSSPQQPIQLSSNDLLAIIGRLNVERDVLVSQYNDLERRLTAALDKIADLENKTYPLDVESKE